MGFRPGSELGLLTKALWGELLVRKHVPRPYTKPTRYNPRLSFEQYLIVLERKHKAAAERERVRYKDLVKEWGVRQSVIGTALKRGIKQYEYRIWKEGKENSLREQR